MYDNETMCRRCGILVVLKNRKRNNVYCKDCRIKPTNVITYGNDDCVPWNGDFDRETDAPMENGVLFMPGKRFCKHADCVNADHIEKEENK